MEPVVDLRLFGVMALIAYIAFSFVGDAFNPLATSRRTSRSLRLGFARSVAVVLLASPLVTMWIQVQGFMDGILWSLAAASVPLSLLSLGFGFVAFRRWQVRRHERIDPEFGVGSETPAMTLDQLRELNSSTPVEEEAGVSEPEDAGVSEPVEPVVKQKHGETDLVK